MRAVLSMAQMVRIFTNGNFHHAKVVPLDWSYKDA
jgi:hypothetical protein